jgi:hypothetical protein
MAIGRLLAAWVQFGRQTPADEQPGIVGYGEPDRTAGNAYLSVA